MAQTTEGGADARGVRQRPARAPAIAAGCAAVALAGLGLAGASQRLLAAALAAAVLALHLARRVRAEGEPTVIAWPFIVVQLLVCASYVAIILVTPWPSLRSLLLAMAALLFVAIGLCLPRWTPVALATATAMQMTAVLAVPSWTLGGIALLLTGASLLFVDDRPRSRLVVWDDTCSFCRSSVQLLTRLDWLHVHRFEGSSRDEVLAEAHVTRDDAEEELKLWDGRRTLGGFDAIRGILESMPAGFFWARILAFPPLAAIGRAAYRSVARRRHCLLPPR